MSKKKKKSESKSKLLWGFGIGLATAILVFVLLFVFDTRPATHEEKIDQLIQDPASQDLDKEDRDDINENTLGDDIKEAEDKKQEAIKPVEKHDDGKKKASVIIGFAGKAGNHIDAGASVTNLVERGGQCKFNFRAPSGQAMSITTNALASAKETPCEAASVTSDETGEWRVSVEYSSATAFGKSEEMRFTVK